MQKLYLQDEGEMPVGADEPDADDLGEEAKSG